LLFLARTVRGIGDLERAQNRRYPLLYTMAMCDKP
jgi:hypothetical protein